MAETDNLSPAGGSAGRRIQKQEFLDMARAYRKQRLDIITRYGNNPKDSRSCYFSRDIYEKMLASGCDGIRTYYGVRTDPSDGKNYTTLLMVGVQINTLTGQETIAKVTEGEEESEVIYEWGKICPPETDCDDNPLLIEIDNL